MNKQELIDNLIHSTSGKLDDMNYLVYFADAGFNVKLSEIKQRARELGYINGYRWGVEYPTNGKKSDLPDNLDVMVRSTNTGLWCDERMVISNFWPHTKSFKITDERHKPVDTSYLDNRTDAQLAKEMASEKLRKDGADNLDELKAGNLNVPKCKYNGVADIDQDKIESMSLLDVANSDWFDYEAQKAVTLPPVGTKCQVLIDNEFTNCTVIHHANNHLSVVAAFKYPQVKDSDVGRLGWSVNFRPLDWNSKAEAEKKRVVDAAAKKFHASIMHDCSGRPILDGLSALYDAGYLRMPDAPKQPKLKTAEQIYGAAFDKICDDHEESKRANDGFMSTDGWEIE
jgi:hypothetical protein